MFFNTMIQFKIALMPREMVKAAVKRNLHYPVCLALLEVLKGNAVHLWASHNHLKNMPQYGASVMESQKRKFYYFNLCF